MELLYIGFQVGLSGRQFAVADLGDALIVSLTFLLRGFIAQRLDQSLARTDGDDQLLLCGPARTQRTSLFLELGHLTANGYQARLCLAFFIARNGSALDLQLA